MAKDSNPFVDALQPFLSPPLPPPEDQPYYAAIGKFIASYAMAENQVHVLARLLSGLSDTKARIIFSGMRLGDLADRIRGLLRVIRASTKRYDEIDACLRQLDLIATQRNNLVHRFVQYREGKIIVTNVVISKSMHAPEYQTFSISDFEQMENDCTAITMRVWAASPGKKDKVGKDLKAWVYAPWRYKPAPPGTPQKPPQQVPQSPKHRSPASRE
jgi:hypothetical protein